jgi:hypothetical protein
MIKLQATVCIEASPEKVWAALARLEDIRLWSREVLHASCPEGKSQGIGAERTCKLKGNITLIETWTAWEEGKSFTYEGLGLPLIKKATNTWSIREDNGKILLTSNATVEVKGGIFGKLLEPLMAPMMRRISPKAFASFKYLVENGKAFEGNYSSLPKIPVAC